MRRKSRLGQSIEETIIAASRKEQATPGYLPLFAQYKSKDLIAINARIDALQQERANAQNMGSEAYDAWYKELRLARAMRDDLIAHQEELQGRRNFRQPPSLKDDSFRTLMKLTAQFQDLQFTEEVRRRNYLATVVSFNEDQWGRLYLMDAYTGRFSNDRSMSYNESNDSTVLALSGASTTVVLARIDADPGERYYESGLDFIRQHGSPGARIKGSGCGALVYMASAAGAKYFGNYEGIASPKAGENANRTSAADRLWDSFERQGITERVDSGDGGEETMEIQHCERIRDRHVEDVDGEGTDGYISSDEVCGDVDVEYQRPGNIVDFLSGDKLFETPFVVFVNTHLYDGARIIAPAYRMGSNFSNKWERKDGKYATNDNPLGDDPTIDSFGVKLSMRYADEQGRPIVPSETCELLVRAYHGANTNVVFAIADLLHRCGTQEQLTTYLSRSDVAESIQGDQRILELMGQQRLPGVAGLSAANHQKVMHAVRFGSLAEAVAANPTNPLNFKPFSPRLAKVLGKFRALEE